MRELQTHVDDRLQELEDAGLSHDEAMRTLLQRFERPRALARKYQDAHSVSTWNDAAIAASAFLLAGVLYASHLWSNAAAVIAVAAVIVAVTLYGLWQGRPRWFYPWAGLALTLLSICGYFAFLLLDRAAGSLGEGGYEPFSLLGIAGALIYVPLAIAILASCVRVASGRDWLDASLMLSPSVPVIAWLTTLHQNGGALEARDAIAGADTALAVAFLAMALAAAVYVRAHARQVRMVTLLAMGFVLLLTISGMQDAGLSLTALMGRALLLFGFLLSPVALEAFALRRMERATFSE